MKKLFMLVTLLFCIRCYAQQDTTRVEQYCEVIADNVSIFSGKVTININYGGERKARKEHRLADENGKPVIFNSVIDAINFLGKKGWKLFSVFPVSFDTKFGNLEYHYLFRKEFAKSELPPEDK